MAQQPLHSAEVHLYWSARSKTWSIHVASVGQVPAWVWTLQAETQVPLDSGTGWLIARAIADALEAQLI